MTRNEIVRVLERLSFAADLNGDRRARAWKGAAWAIRQLDEDLAILVDERRLERVRGVGPSTARLVSDLLDGIRPRLLDEIERDVPEGLFAIKRLKGLGAKKVKALWKDLGITTLVELEQACRENRLVALSGFGSKTQAKVLAQIETQRANEGKLRRDHAERLLDETVIALEEAGFAVVTVGEFRRGFEVVEDPAVVATGRALAATGRALAAEGVALHVCALEQLGWQALQRTASLDHIQALRDRASERDVDLVTLHAATEDDVYRALGLHPTPAERREPSVPLVELGSAAPRLVRRRDLRGALHNHTTASDGSHTLLQMRDAAAARSLEYLGISEHSVSAFYAGGLKAEALMEQRRTIAELNGTGHACTLLSGIESDILREGELDYDDAVLADLDVVVASVHRRFRADRAAMTRRMVAAASHPLTTVIGHPTGRLLLGRAESDFDVEALLDACAAHGCAVELNANPARLDLSATHLAMAKERGVLVSISADAHCIGELDNLSHGIAIARRAGLTVADVLNTRSLVDLQQWLDAR